MAKYTPEQTERIVSVYCEARDDGASYDERAQVVTNLAQEFSESEASIRAVLVRSGVYVAKEYQTKKGERPVTKEVWVQNIAARIGVASDMLPGLEKANKNTLRRIFTALPEQAD